MKRLYPALAVASLLGAPLAAATEVQSRFTFDHSGLEGRFTSPTSQARVAAEGAAALAMAEALSSIPGGLWTFSAAAAAPSGPHLLGRIQHRGDGYAMFVDFAGVGPPKPVWTFTLRSAAAALALGPPTEHDIPADLKRELANVARYDLVQKLSPFFAICTGANLKGATAIIDLEWTRVCAYASSGFLIHAQRQTGAARVKLSSDGTTDKIEWPGTSRRALQVELKLMDTAPVVPQLYPRIRELKPVMVMLDRYKVDDTPCRDIPVVPP